MIINHNLNAMNSHRQMGIAVNGQAKAMEKLSSGLRINRAGDDAAGLAISEKMRGQIRGLDQASRNSQDAISMIQTAEGSLNESQAILQRMRELGVQAANGTNTSTETDFVKNELTELKDELARIKDNTEFNEKNLLDGTAKTVAIQVGANKGQIMNLNFATTGINLSSIATSIGTIDVSTNGKANTFIDMVERQIQRVSKGRSTLGAWQNRLEHTIKNLDNSSENLQAAESRIRDVDMAKEMMNQSKLSILNQASQAMLAQANQQPQGVLQLLR